MIINRHIIFKTYSGHTEVPSTFNVVLFKNAP